MQYRSKRNSLLSVTSVEDISVNELALVSDVVNMHPT